MNDKISNKDKKDWQNFISSKDKLPNKDFQIKKKNFEKIRKTLLRIVQKLKNIDKDNEKITGKLKLNYNIASNNIQERYKYEEELQKIKNYLDTIYSFLKDLDTY